jgi:hypothetical protein
MKTKLSTVCILSLLLSACGDKADGPAGQGGTRGGVLLTTELPPELIEGTPPPIRLPLQTPMSN